MSAAPAVVPSTASLHRFIYLLKKAALSPLFLIIFSSKSPDMSEKCGVSGISAGDGAGGCWWVKGWQPLAEGGSVWMSRGKRGDKLSPVAPACARLSLAHCFGQDHQVS